MKYNSLNQKVRPTNTKYLLKRRHEAFPKTSIHYQGILSLVSRKASCLRFKKYFLFVDLTNKSFQ